MKNIIRYRTEKDSFGSVKIPKNRLWGVQTQRAIKYFNISKEKIPHEMLIALILIKRAAAKVNYHLRLINKEFYMAIIEASDKIIKCKKTLKKEFPITIWQSGSGTQTNMNVNEVLANKANIILKKKK